ncbi:hypothetical protein KAZ66_02960 [Candidatus Woesebacteria bacterium]|nr:hypothetical protein [Candidatus Woesebacteria bacterium]
MTQLVTVTYEAFQRSVLLGMRRSAGRIGFITTVPWIEPTWIEASTIVDIPPKCKFADFYRYLDTETLYRIVTQESPPILMFRCYAGDVYCIVGGPDAYQCLTMEKQQFLRFFKPMLGKTIRTKVERLMIDIRNGKITVVPIQYFKYEGTTADASGMIGCDWRVLI